MAYQGWALFMDGDMFCCADGAGPWALLHGRFAVMGVQHQHRICQTVKFLGELQSLQPSKNWSSRMMLNCSRCTALTPDVVNSATGLELHGFQWLAADHEIGALPQGWNPLVGVQDPALAIDSSMLQRTLGGPCFREQRPMGALAVEWFASRNAALRLCG